MFVPLQESVPVVDPSAASGVLSLLWVIIALPALGATVILLLGNTRTSRWAHWLGCGTLIGSFVLSLVSFLTILGRPADDRQVSQQLWTWVQVGSFKVDMGLLYDPLSALFLLLITGVGSLIHIYSIGYMEHDVRRARFFAYLNLFVAAMLTLVLADNYLVVFLGWEGVGLASYLLIGFWQHKTSAAVAAKKAFVVNRVGDLGMALGTMLVFTTFGTVAFTGVSAAAGRAPRVHDDRARPAVPARRLRQVRAGAAPVLAARRHGGPHPGLGADPRRDDGDRRRLPGGPLQLHLRLRPGRADRGGRGRRGHAAVGRGHRLREGRHQEGPRRLHDEPDRLHDARRGLGPAGYAFAIFHLLTHGFFKADMFLGAGSVMHAMDDDVDMRHYGALARAIPVTFATFAVGYLAIIGVPPFAGFWSKDKVIEAAFGQNPVAGIAALVGAGITAFYMTRLMLMTFVGKKRWAEGVHPHESPRTMTGPLVVLAALSALGGLLLVGSWIVDWLAPVVGPEPHEVLPVPAIVISLVVLVIVVLGIAVAWLTVGRHEVPRTAPAKVSFVTRAARADLYGDAINEGLLMRPGDRLVTDLATFDDDGLDRAVTGTGAAFVGMSGTFRRVQTGFVRSYALTVFGGAVLVVLALLAVNIA